MRRIKILNWGLTPLDVERLKALAVDAAFDRKEIVIVDAVGEPIPDCNDEIVLILASPATRNDHRLETELATAQRGGRRAICVWPSGSDSTAAPSEAMKKYAYSIIRFDPVRLRLVSADDDELCFENPVGQPMPKPETERNLCVDVKEPPK